VAGTTLFSYADLLKTKAEVLMGLEHAEQEEIEELLAQALACAREQCALSWELRVIPLIIWRTSGVFVGSGKP
jgi:uncharacterized protein YciU (UPF0263 family)